MRDTLEVIIPSIFAIVGIGLGWWINTIRHGRQYEVIRSEDRDEAPGDEPMCRPAEFGPLMQSREVIDRIRDAIVEDQLGARKESPKQRRQRMTRLAGFTDRQRVQHWLLHWREDYMADLTGRAVGVGWGIAA